MPAPSCCTEVTSSSSCKRFSQSGGAWSCYMGHADLRGTQYYLRLTADACPEVMARAQVRFGYVIPAPPGDEP